MTPYTTALVGKTMSFSKAGRKKLKKNENSKDITTEIDKMDKTVVRTPNEWVHVRSICLMENKNIGGELRKVIFEWWFGFVPRRRRRHLLTYTHHRHIYFLLEYELRAERYRKTTSKEWERERESTQSYVSQYLTFSEHSTEPTADVSEVVYTKAYSHTYTNDVIASNNNNRRIKRGNDCVCA